MKDLDLVKIPVLYAEEYTNEANEHWYINPKTITGISIDNADVAWVYVQGPIKSIETTRKAAEQLMTLRAKITDLT